MTQAYKADNDRQAPALSPSKSRCATVSLLFRLRRSYSGAYRTVHIRWWLTAVQEALGAAGNAPAHSDRSRSSEHHRPLVSSREQSDAPRGNAGRTKGQGGGGGVGVGVGVGRRRGD